MSLASLSPCLVVLVVFVVIVGIIGLIRAWGGMIFGCVCVIVFVLCMALVWNWFMSL